MLNTTLHGQQLAVRRIMPWISRIQRGLTRDDGPAGVFLFLGPTGTGKTRLGKELARYVYGNEDEMLFFEMGQFKAKESINMFIGSSNYYHCHDGGQLPNGLRDHPECVVVFDEIEKADITVFNAMLRFVDEGLVTEPSGSVRDGRKCIIVMTSNAGQAWLRQHVNEHPDTSENPDRLATRVLEEASKELATMGFDPEFMQRVDECIPFLPLSLTTCRQIVDGVLKKTLLEFEGKGVMIEIPDDVSDLLAKCTFDASRDQGARAAPRAVNKYITGPAIDILVPFAENGEALPPNLIAVACGKDGISLEISNGNGSKTT